MEDPGSDDVKFSLRDLMLWPLMGLAAVPIVTSAAFVGVLLLPQFMASGSAIRQWFLARGFPSSFVTGYLTFLVSDIPSILVLAVLAVLLFAIRTRLCDHFAVVSLASLPFVEALQGIPLLRFYFAGASDTYLGWIHLKTHALTVVAMTSVITAYVFARRRLPNPPPSRARKWISALAIGSILAASIPIWKLVGDQLAELQDAASSNQSR